MLERIPYHRDMRERLSILRFLAKWAAILLPVAAVIGSACAFFLWSLDELTRLRQAHTWLLYLLPLAGVAVAALYHYLGKSAEGGNNLIVDQIHSPGGGVPKRMAPLVLAGTLITHLFGGSAGREGTAVQMGGSLASGARQLLRLNSHDTRLLLMCGVAAGFAAVFGTPLAGTVFALEVLTLGAIGYEALIPCLVAALIGDWTCSAWGIHHTHYHIALDGAPVSPWSAVLMLKTVLAAVAFGLAAQLFAVTAHGIQAFLKKRVPQPLLRPAIGGAAVILLFFVVGTDDYLGLGVTPSHPGGASIVTAFGHPAAENAASTPEFSSGVTHFSWLWKLVFTCVTIGSGFKGGEVTPLFFIGATLGNVLGKFLNAPVDLFAGLGFVAVFAGAANTPLACTLMAVELFGSTHTVNFAAACFIAYLFSGHAGIYRTQRIGVRKH
jgi:H+/Cl- antiporter ClcA